MFPGVFPKAAKRGGRKHSSDSAYTYCRPLSSGRVNCGGADTSTLLSHKYGSGMMSAFSLLDPPPAYASHSPIDHDIPFSPLSCLSRPPCI